MDMKRIVKVEDAKRFYYQFDQNYHTQAIKLKVN